MRQIGPYKLSRVIGSGGMGRVFEAINNNSGQTVALKIIKGRQAANEDARMRFVQEARAARQLDHPNIVAILDFGQARGALYIAMEYLPGLPLASFIPGPPTLSLRRKLSIMSQCADALAYAHSRGVVHRDVKPANMIVVQDKSVKLVDFGLAELTSLPNLKVHGGTPPYMSPEQFSPRDVDGRSDIWSAGVTLFELLAGRLPYRSLDEIANGPVPTLPQSFPFAAEINALLGRALAKDRALRYGSAEQFAADLRAIREKVEQAPAPARSNDMAHGGEPAAGTSPSEAETVRLAPLILVSGDVVVSPLDIDRTLPSPARQPASAPPTGRYALPELGFLHPAEGAVETSVGRFEWNERVATIQNWRGTFGTKERLPVVWLAAFFAASVLCLSVVGLLPRLSPDARNQLYGLGLLASAYASFALMPLIWLALTVCIQACRALGAAEHVPLCKSCNVRMHRTRDCTRVCSSREEVFFGYRDCVAALKRRLWQEAANLLSIYGEEHLSKYRERFISPSLRYHIAFFECAGCGNHAARLTADEMIEKRWEEQVRFEEAVWGNAATCSGPGAPGLRSDLRLAPAAIRNFFGKGPDRPALTAGGILVLLSLVAWIAVPRAVQPPVSRRVSKVALSNTGRWLASGTHHGRIVIWDLPSGGAPRQTTFSPGALNDLQFSPDEQVLAVASSDLGFYSPDQPTGPRLVRADKKDYRSVRFSRDGQALLAVTRAGLIETIDAHSGASRLKLCCSSIYGQVGEALFTPDGASIANAGAWPGLWDTRSGQFLGRLPTDQFSHNFRPLAFDARYDRIVMGSDGAAVWAWDWKQRRLLGGVRAPWIADVDSLTVSGTGSVFFAGPSVAVWSAETGQVHSWSKARPTSNLVLSADGTALIFGTAAGEIEFWNVITARRIRAIKLPGE